MKKTSIILLSLTVLLTVSLCACVLHREEFAFTPSYEQKELTLTMYSGSDPEVTVPQSHWGMPVTAIGKNAFPYSKGIVSITLPNTVESILSLAFANCTSLKTVNLPDSLKEIQSSAFKNCSSLEKVTIPKGVEKIAPLAFEGCSSLMQFNVSSENKHYRSIDGHLYYENTLATCAPCSVGGEFTVAEGTQRISSAAFSGCSTLEIVFVPESVVDFAADAFLNCNSIREIRFAGTTDQWYDMSSRPDFSGRYVSIVCSNGTLSSGN